MTKRLVSGALVLLLAAGVCVADDKDFTSKTGKFSARFPGKPKEQDVSAAGASGKTVIFEGKDGSTCSITYADLPDVAKEALKTPEQVELVLGLTRDAAIAQMKGKLLEDSKAKVEGGAGRAFTVELPDKKIMRNQMILSGTRIYQVMVVGSSDYVKSDEATKFLQSFKIMK
jgi:hypothetical protein